MVSPEDLGRVPLVCIWYATLLEQSDALVLKANRLKIYRLQLTNDQNDPTSIQINCCINLQACNNNNNNHSVFAGVTKVGGETRLLQDVGLPWLEFGGTEIRCCICCKEEGDEEEDEVAFPEPDLGQPSVPGAERGRELVAVWCPAD